MENRMDTLKRWAAFVMAVVLTVGMGVAATDPVKLVPDNDRTFYGSNEHLALK